METNIHLQQYNINSLISIIILQGHTKFWNEWHSATPSIQHSCYVNQMAQQYLTTHHELHWHITLYTKDFYKFNYCNVIQGLVCIGTDMCLSQNIFNKISIKINFTLRNCCIRRHYNRSTIYFQCLELFLFLIIPNDLQG